MILQTQRLILRKITLDDVDAFLPLFSDPETMRFYPSTRDRQQTREWVDRQLERYKVDGYGPWAMLVRDTELLIGHCGLAHQEVEGKHELEIGYMVNRAHWGQGFAGEAACACRDYAFNTIGVSRVISLIDPGNTASIRVAEKVGMSPEKKVMMWNKQLLLYSLDDR